MLLMKNQRSKNFPGFNLVPGVGVQPTPSLAQDKYNTLVPRKELDRRVVRFSLRDIFPENRCNHFFEFSPLWATKGLRTPSVNTLKLGE